jgi:hypothetical protein
LEFGHLDPSSKGRIKPIRDPVRRGLNRHRGKEHRDHRICHFVATRFCGCATAG